MKARLHLRIPKDVKKKIVSEAKRQGMSVSNYVWTNLMKIINKSPKLGGDLDPGV